MMSKYRQTLLVASSLGILGLFAGCYQVSVSFEPSETEVASTSVQIPSKQDTPSNVSLNTVSTNLTSQPLTYSSVKANKNIGVGTLRLSNQTNQPVRLALLERSKQKPETSQAHIPAHWDFAPQEGSSKGLVLSLPNGKLLLAKGDVVVAFAQDGSRRYWGPYVVGESPFPVWNSQQKEWWLILNK
ncbi:hypothetical protein NIES4071_29330 [Calothrix sp. NIES-4071]|nr:hypothetical protein NIES4071_29330 [Calothrix sp. NIES-4071]BAZ57253.1 hypothetical protein NIES4105_29270 [Calothrix sp. NIES-4105]